MTGPKLHYASQFIIAAMDEWGGPVTPTTGTPVYLKQDYDALQAKVRELEERIQDLEAKLRKAEERLEIDHEYVPNNYTGELERVEVPAQERSKYPDGITCRDATIKLQDER